MMRSSSGILRRLFSRSAKSGRMPMSTMARAASPWLMLAPGRGSSGDIIYNFYSLAEEKHVSLGGGFELAEGTRFVGSSQGWVGLYSECSKHLFITNPISGRRIDLPPIDTLPNPEINLRNGVSKVVLSSSPDDDDEWRALMTFGPGNCLALCSRNAAWTPLGRPFRDYEHPTKRFARVYADMVYSREGRCFICAPTGSDFECWSFDEDDPKVTPIHKPCLMLDVQILEAETDAASEYPYLVGAPDFDRFVIHLVYAEQLNQLFYVVRCVDMCPYKTIHFFVFKVENNGMKWVQHSLDGLAMFVGINHSFAVSAADFPQIKPNSIYFTDPNPALLTPPHFTDKDIGIFDFENQTVSPCYYPLHAWMKIDPLHKPLWFTPAPH